MMAPLAHASTSTFHCTVGPLLGVNETPPTPSPGSGTIDLIVDTSANDVQFTLAFSGLTGSSTAAHIHEAPVGVAGPVKVPLPLDSALGLTSGSVTGTGTPIAGFNVADIVATPTNFYVNVHSSTFPAGEIRGQVIQCTPVSASVPQFSGPASLPLLAVVLIFPLIMALKKRTSVSYSR